MTHLLLQAGLFSAVSAAFVIDIHSNLQPVPNEKSATLLLAILLTLNQSAIPGETFTVPHIEEGPSTEIVTTACLMYASLFISLLAAFIAMLGRQWLNRYLRHSGGSMIERCGDRQRKWDGLERWPLHFFVESLSAMLQVSLFLLACGLCRHMWSINTPVAYTLIGLTGLGATFYIVILIAGTSSYACPFQTPVSTALRGLWKRVKQALSCIRQSWHRRASPFCCCSSLLPTTSRRGVKVQGSEPWLKPEDLTIIRTTNANDAGCILWILRNITDPEALNAAIRLAGTIRWFDDGINVDVPYDLVVSMFEACFGPSGKLYPGSRDMAYYSGQAIVWIHGLASCKSEKMALRFPLSSKCYGGTDLDPDLEHLLHVNLASTPRGRRLSQLLAIDPEHTPSHTQWISDVLLHYYWATRTHSDNKGILNRILYVHETTTIIPLNATLNRLLVWCIFFGSPPAKEGLEIQNKSCDTSYFEKKNTHSTLR